MKHLVIGSDLFKPSIGGTETVTHNMAANLTKKGFRVTVVAPTRKGRKTPYTEKDDAGYDILRVRSLGTPIEKNLRFGLRPYQEIETYFTQPTNTVDIVHGNNPFAISKALCRFAKRHDLPFVFGSHLMPESFTFVLRRLGGLQRFLDGIGWRIIAKAYNKGDKVVAPTKTALGYLESHGLRVPTQAISNGIDLKVDKPLGLEDIQRAKLREDLGLSAQYVLVYAGRLAVEKRIDVIITAMSQLVTQFDVELILVGDGNAKTKLAKLTKKLGLTKKVHFAGYVQDWSNKARYFAASDAFVIASPVELQSIVTLEAMAAGLPIFAVSAGALPELAVNGKNGATFRDGDGLDLARKVGRVLHDPVLLKKYHKASLEMIQHHNIDDTWVQYEAMYLDLLAKNS